ncbi:MAG: chromosome segregation protein SMC [Candidatus Hodarchaeota archaeon]
MVYVKYMKLRGFKSVGATKTVTINFDKGFSSIVGANGSGKSNILEAFSFVMGQLSAKNLRGGNMKHMIFSGNKKKGIPPASEAFVELIFDNQDRGFPIEADIVKFSRRVTRSGNGTYKLNGKTTTRGEITDLLSMSGLDANSYNMVLQGNVYEVVNMTKNERRKLIEDIAGIAAYDEKKESAQRELDNVETNLAQIRLLLNEVSTQLDMLEKEKDDALKYQELNTKLQFSSQALKVLEIGDLKSELTRSIEKTSDIKEKLAEIAGEIDSKELELDEARKKIHALTETLRLKQSTEMLELNQNLDDLKQQLSDINSEIKYLHQGKKSNEKESEHLKSEVQTLQEEESRLKKEIQELNAEIESEQGELVSSEGIKQEKVAELASHDEKYQQLIEEKEEKRKELMDIKGELQELNSEMKVTSNYLNGNKDEFEKLNQSISSFTTNTSTIVSNLNSLRNKIEDDYQNLHDSPEQIQKKIATLESELRVTKEMVRNKAEKLYEVRSTIKAAKHFSNNGVNRAINALLDAKEKGIIQGIFNTVGNLGKVDSKYNVAMDIAAGSRINFMVVRDRNVATECIRYLKKNKLGRVSFIPLDKIHYKEPERGLTHIEGVYGRAVDLIDFDNAFIPAFEFIFGRTYIVHDLEVAKLFAPKYRRVTLDGDVIDPSNLMTGGSVNKKNAGGAFKSSEESQLPALERELDQLKIKELHLEREIKDFQGKISDYYTFKIEIEKKKSSVKAEIAKLETRLEEMERNKVDSLEKIDGLKAEIEQDQAKKEELAGKIQACKDKINNVKMAIDSIDQQLADSPHARLKSEIDELEIKIKKLESSINKINLKLAQKNTRLEEHVLHSLSSNEAKIKELSTEHADLGVKIEEEVSNKVIVTGKIGNLEQEIAAKNEELSELIAEKNEMENAKEALRNELQRLSLKSQSQDLQLASLEEKIMQLNEAITSLETELPEETNIPAEYLELPKNSLIADIETCKREIEGMGNVNMMAIDKYNENKARFDELNMRHGLLVEERESILEFMDSVEKQKKTAFMQTFQSISRNFTYVFSRLSPGGTGQLELENMENPFEGGVLIMARPSGKPLTEISLLSGGEKSLTSLSLIFAIQQHCPSPLYILDEIDAALDDANAALVADLIKELSNRSQFIIITHRDVTMTKSDQILGVSNVDGVTNVFNLDLQEISKIMMES